MSRLTTVVRTIAVACAAASLALSLRTASRLSSSREESPAPPAAPESPPPVSPELERLRAESRDLLERVKALPAKGPSGDGTLTTGQLRAIVQDALDLRERDAMRRRLVAGFPEVQKENKRVVGLWKSAAGSAPNQEARWEEALRGLDESSRLAAQEALDVADYHRRMTEARGEAERAIETWLTPEQREQKARVGVSNDGK